MSIPADMTAEQAIEELGRRMYVPPLVNVRYEPGYPDLANPLHILFLLADCDIEIQVNGLLGFLENGTGEHLDSTIQALALIGAERAAKDLRLIAACMSRHGVTWEGLRADFQGAKEFEVTSFAKLHGEKMSAFIEDLRFVGPEFDNFPHPSGDRVFELLGVYLEPRLDHLRQIVRDLDAQAGRDADASPRAAH